MANYSGRPKIFKAEQERWLIAHYPDECNSVLAESLSEMVNEANRQELANINEIICRFSGKERLALEKRQFLLGQKVVITERLIISYANRLHLHKSPDFMHKLMIEKLKVRTLNHLVKKAIFVDKPTKFLRTVEKRRSLYVVKMSSANKLLSFNSLLYRWNKTEGITKGFNIRAQYDYPNCLIKLNTVKI